MVARQLRVGFEVRLSVLTVGGQEVSVVMTRNHARGLGVREGDTVWLTPDSGVAVAPTMEPASA